MGSFSDRRHDASPSRTQASQSASQLRLAVHINGDSTPKHRRPSALGALLSPRPETNQPDLDPLLTADYTIQDHIEAFRDALSHDLGQSEYLPASAAQITGSSTWSMLGFPQSLRSPDVRSPSDPSAPQPVEPLQAASSLAEPSATQAVNPRKVGRIAAASDFAPVREKVHRKKKRVDSGTREGFVYHALRWPLLGAIFLTIFIEFMAYVLIRQIVNVIEYAIAWRGRKGELRKRLRRSTTHAEWKEAALALDEFMGFEPWKMEDASGFYDWILVKKVKASLKAFREKEDTENLLGVLDLCLRNNFAGTENFRLYSETFFGTKYLVESYLSELELALRFVEETDKISLEAKRQFYRTVSRNLGRSALCLSGGASFGYYHIGVVRALLDSNLLPKVVTGTSAGGLIAALTCTRTDEELKRLLVPALADRITACEEPLSVWARRAWATGARFDTVQWAEKCAFFTRGSMTFKEAYERTGKVLCISVIPSDRHSPVKLLNYMTAPDCVIWSSLLASAAVPGILNPVCLMQKTKGGKIMPWNWGHRFKDGSLRVDIPLQDLHALFNVNYPIVSQVNPHVHLFHFGSKGAPGRPTAHRKGKGWRGGFVLSAAEHVLKLHLKMNFKIIRDLDLLPAILGQDWSSVFLQPFGGAVTIWPKTRAWDWVRILTDPDRRELERMIGVGKIVTFPKIHMVENRVRLERTIEAGRRRCRRHMRMAETQGTHMPANGAGNGGATPLAMTTMLGAGLGTGPGVGGARGAGEGGKQRTKSEASEGTGTDDDFFSLGKPTASSASGPRSTSAAAAAAGEGGDGFDTPVLPPLPPSPSSGRGQKLNRPKLVPFNPVAVGKRERWWSRDTDADAEDSLAPANGNGDEDGKGQEGRDLRPTRLWGEGAQWDDRSHLESSESSEEDF
ncbi:hypothetical protein ACQY0O_006400 [Thecaphora frezii]